LCEKSFSFCPLCICVLSVLSFVYIFSCLICLHYLWPHYVLFIQYLNFLNFQKNFACVCNAYNSEVLFIHPFIIGAHSSVVGWGTVLQARRSQVRFPTRSLDFSIDLTLPAALRPRGPLSL
jgi:hypothetical protein